MRHRCEPRNGLIRCSEAEPAPFTMTGNGIEVRSAVRSAHVRIRVAPIAQLAEAADLKSAQCGFESHWGHESSSLVRGLDLGWFSNLAVEPRRAQMSVRVGDSEVMLWCLRHRDGDDRGVQHEHDLADRDRGEDLPSARVARRFRTLALVRVSPWEAGSASRRPSNAGGEGARGPRGVPMRERWECRRGRACR